MWSFRPIEGYHGITEIKKIIAMKQQKNEQEERKEDEDQNINLKQDLVSLAGNMDESCQSNHWKEHKQQCRLKKRKPTYIENKFVPSNENNFWNPSSTYYKNTKIRKGCTSIVLFDDTYIDGCEKNSRLVLIGNLFRCLSKGFFNHYFLLFCGFIRQNIASSDWMIERQRLGLKNTITKRRMHGASNFGRIFKYDADYINRDIYDFIPKRYRPHYSNRDILYSIITISFIYFLPPLSNKKSFKYIKLRNHKSIIDKIHQQMVNNKSYFNHGFALIQNTMRKYCFDWMHYDVANNNNVICIPREKERAMAKDSIIVIILFSYLIHSDYMIFSLTNGNYVYIEPNLIEIFDKQQQLHDKYQHLKAHSIWKCENGHKMSNFYFKWSNIKQKAITKYKIRKYYLNPAIFGPKCIVQMGKIYTNKGKDLIEFQERLIKVLFPPKMTI